MLQIIEDLRTIRRMPRVSVSLMLAAAKDNDPFFERVVRGFYAETRRRRRWFPLARRWQYGVALCPLPGTFDEYFMRIEAAARRNYKKAARQGYTFARIDPNDHLGEIAAIWKSAEVRQGRMPAHFVEGRVKPYTNPPSRTDVHDYPYFGVLKDGALYAYAGNMVAGELFMIEQIYGHAAHHAEGVVPLLIIGMAESMMRHYPHVKYYGYEMFFGASPTMRRFKKKFLFLPHRVEWQLG
ncbi:MAG: hypothetical protein FJ388_24840 [Verrucomicrobia bacterium]|nr:hypothetical protein [Verrucomicrobiota bacterium]